MTIDEVKKLIAKDETRTLELKKTTGELHRGMETACAFLNSDGGWLMFGIAPNLKITGQNVTDATRQEIANALRKIEPAVDVEVEYIELPDKPDLYVIAIYFSMPPTSRMVLILLTGGRSTRGGEHHGCHAPHHV